MNLTGYLVCFLVQKNKINKTMPNNTFVYIHDAKKDLYNVNSNSYVPQNCTKKYIYKDSYSQWKNKKVRAAVTQRGKNAKK